MDMVCEQKELKNMLVHNPSDFSRNRKLGLRRVAGMILNMPKRSLSIELVEFFEALGAGASPASKGAFSLQRTKLLPMFFEVWNKLLVDCFYNYYGESVRRWKGFRVQAVDGSTAYLVDRPDVVAEFGTQPNQHGDIPMARVMQIYDVLNGIDIWGGIFPLKLGEQAVMAGRVHSLSPDSLTLFDRNYPSYALIYSMLNEESPRHFVMRCKSNFNNEVRRFVQSDSTSEIVQFRPGTNAISKLWENGHHVTADTEITVRMVKVPLSTGEIEILLTNLYDEHIYSVGDLKYLYGLRWVIETAYGIQKNQQQMEQFSGHRPICIRQDYAAGLLLANLQSLIEKQCTPYLDQLGKKRKYEYKVNKNISWACMKHKVVKLFLENQPMELLIELQHAFERNVEPIRPGRHYERQRKTKRTKGKYQTLTNYKRAI